MTSSFLVGMFQLCALLVSRTKSKLDCWKSITDINGVIKCRLVADRSPAVRWSSNAAQEHDSIK